MNASPVELLLDLRQISLASMGLYLNLEYCRKCILVERGYSIQALS